MIPTETSDIIAALGTPLGEAAIGIVRLSGSGSIKLVEGIFRSRHPALKLSQVTSHTVHLGLICNSEGEVLDEVLVCVMRAPRTYTREDVVEIYCHGGITPVRHVLDLVLDKGARLAEPGEFTKRAFLNGRIDLVQAEAVLDVIRARTRASVGLALKQLKGNLSAAIYELRDELRHVLAEAEAELDFPEDVEARSSPAWIYKLGILRKKIDKLIAGGKIGRLYREGLATTLVGKPNVGKSTLLNLLLGEERVLVTEVPGTTRDIIEEVITLRGIPLRLIDTAGIREHAGVVECLGIKRAREAAARADLVLVVLDAETGLTREDFLVLDLLHGKKGVVILNKVDSTARRLDKGDVAPWVDGRPVVELSAKYGWGLDSLEEKIWEVIGAGVVGGEELVVTKARHQSVLIRVRGSLDEALEGLKGGLPLDCVTLDLREAWSSLGEITGETIGEEVVDEIFREFCIGK